MEYQKPELIELDVKIAGGATCNWGYTNYSSGCRQGLGNAVNCQSGSAFGQGGGCKPFGMSAFPPCQGGWGVS